MPCIAPSSNSESPYVGPANSHNGSGMLPPLLDFGAQFLRDPQRRLLGEDTTLRLGQCTRAGFEAAWPRVGSD